MMAGYSADTVPRTQLLYSTLEGKLSNQLFCNKYADSKRKPNTKVKLKSPYYEILKLYGANHNPLPLSPPKKEKKSSKDQLFFEVLYFSMKYNRVATFELIVDFGKQTVRVNNFHEPAKRFYLLEDFKLPDSSEKHLCLSLKRERTEEILTLNINLGNQNLKECNYFSGTYSGTSFRTNNSIYGAIYLLRDDFLDNGEDREKYRSEVERRLNLETPSGSIKVLDSSMFIKDEQQRSSREELLAEQAGVYLACRLKKEKNGVYMEVAVFELRNDFTASFRFPWKKQKTYKGYAEISQALGKQALILKAVDAPPNDPFMLAMLEIPPENEERDSNKLKGSFCMFNERGGLVLHRLDLKDSKGIDPEKINVKAIESALHIELLEILQELNQA